MASKKSQSKKTKPAKKNSSTPKTSSNRVITRMFVSVTEAMELTGLQKRSVQNIFKEIRERNGKEPQSLVTIKELATQLKASPEDVLKNLGYNTPPA